MPLCCFVVEVHVHTFLNAARSAIHLAFDPEMTPSEYCKPSFIIAGWMPPVEKLWEKEKKREGGRAGGKGGRKERKRERGGSRKEEKKGGRGGGREGICLFPA